MHFFFLYHFSKMFLSHFFSAQKFVLLRLGFFFFSFIQCIKETIFIQFLMTKAVGKFKSYLKEQQSFSKSRFINAFTKVGNHPEDRYLNESTALTVRKDSAQLYWWKTQKGTYFKCPSEEKAPVLLECSETWDCSLYKIKKENNLDLTNSAVDGTTSFPTPAPH